MLQMGHEWANPPRRSGRGTVRREVMPHFQGQVTDLDAATRASQARDDLAQTPFQAVEHMTKKYQDEVGSASGAAKADSGAPKR